MYIYVKENMKKIFILFFILLNSDSNVFKLTSKLTILEPIHNNYWYIFNVLIAIKSICK